MHLVGLLLLRRVSLLSSAFLLLSVVSFDVFVPIVELLHQRLCHQQTLLQLVNRHIFDKVTWKRVSKSAAVQSSQFLIASCSEMEWAHGKLCRSAIIVLLDIDLLIVWIAFVLLEYNVVLDFIQLNQRLFHFYFWIVPRLDVHSELVKWRNLTVDWTTESVAAADLRQSWRLLVTL